MNKPTRGTGSLEKFLAKKRVHMANKLIPEILRNGRIFDIGCSDTSFFLLNTEFNEKYGIDSSLKNIDLKENMKFGYFEFFLNSWLYVQR